MQLTFNTKTFLAKILLKMSARWWYWLSMILISYVHSQDFNGDFSNNEPTGSSRIPIVNMSTNQNILQQNSTIYSSLP